MSSYYFPYIPILGWPLTFYFYGERGEPSCIEDNKHLFMSAIWQTISIVGIILLIVL